MPNLNVGLCALFFVGTANAAATLNPGIELISTCDKVTCTSAIINASTTEFWPEITSLDVACSGTIEERCYQNTTTGKYAYVRSCTACKDGYELTSTSYTSGICGNRAPLYNGCQAACTGCDNCDEYVGEWAEYTPTGGMSAPPAGYQYRDSQSCNMSTCACETTRSYRCAKGSYGYATKLSSGEPTGCTRCPTLGSILTGGFVFGTTDGPGTASLITKCYIAAGSHFSDDTGSGIYPEDCPYETDPK